jgi:predicted negative regulator of RcsB-dependent stress response
VTTSVRHDDDAIARIFAWIKQNQRTAKWTAGVVVFLAASVWFYLSYVERRESFAARELQQARSAVASGNAPLAASDLSRIASSYRNTAAGQEAAIVLAQLRLLQGQAALAVPDLRLFLASNPGQGYAASAHALLAAALEQVGNAAEAGKEYEAAAESYPYNFLKAQNLVEAGRVYWAAGDTAKAAAAYGRVLKDFKDQPGALEARIRLSELRRGASTPS